ncbi:DNA-binding protein [Basfia succiniciproducens]|uniref:DNA-binding protein n=1 Tax=Basfia succiniciproducens TaxID=653940 RepID=UPI003FCED92E
MKEWLTVQELLGLNALPATDRGITKKAQREDWIKRQREGVKGKVFEYAFNSLPSEAQAELLLNHAKSAVENPEVLETTTKVLKFSPHFLF